MRIRTANLRKKAHLDRIALNRRFKLRIFCALCSNNTIGMFSKGHYVAGHRFCDTCAKLYKPLRMLDNPNDLTAAIRRINTYIVVSSRMPNWSVVDDFLRRINPRVVGLHLTLLYLRSSFVLRERLVYWKPLLSRALETFDHRYFKGLEN